MTLKEFVMQFGFELDEDSGRQVEESINRLKAFAVDTLGDIGINLSLSNLTELYKQLNSVTDAISEAGAGLSDLFGTDNVNEFNGILSQSAELVKSLSESLHEASERLNALDLTSILGQVNQAPEGNTEAITRPYESALETVNSLAESLSAAFSGADFEPLINGLEQITETLEEVQNGLERFTESTQAGENAQKALTRAGQSGARAFTREATALEQQAEASAKSSEASQTNATAKQAEAQSADTATDSTRALTTATRAFLRQATNVLSTVNGISLAMQGLFANEGGNGDSFSGLTASANEALEALQSLSNAASTNYSTDSFSRLTEPLTALTDGLQSIVEYISTTLTSAWSSAMKEMGDTGVETATDIMSGFSAMADSIMESMSSVSNALSSVQGAVGGSNAQEPAVSDAMQMYLGAANISANDMTAPMNTLNNQISNITVNQNVVINNTFNGSKELQKEAHEAMQGAGEDIAESLAKAMAYSR